MVRWCLVNDYVSRSFVTWRGLVWPYLREDSFSKPSQRQDGRNHDIVSLHFSKPNISDMHVKFLGCNVRVSPFADGFLAGF